MTGVPVAFLDLSFSEILVLGLVAILVFGGNLPDVMRNLGRSYAKFRQGMSDLASPLRDELRQIDPRINLPTARTQPAALPPPASEPPPEPGEPSDPSYQADLDVGAGDPDVPPPEDGAADASTTPEARPRQPDRWDPGGAGDEPPPV